MDIFFKLVRKSHLNFLRVAKKNLVLKHQCLGRGIWNLQAGYVVGSVQWTMFTNDVKTYHHPSPIKNTIMTIRKVENYIFWNISSMTTQPLLKTWWSDEKIKKLLKVMILLLNSPMLMVWWGGAVRWQSYYCHSQMLNVVAPDNVSSGVTQSNFIGWIIYYTQHTT